MHGLKSAILAIFQRGLGWPFPVSAALKNPSLDLKDFRLGIASDGNFSSYLIGRS